MNSDLIIRKLEPHEIPAALSLAWKVFLQYEAPDYTEDGIQEFYRSLHDEAYLSALCVYGAFLSEEPVGMIATRRQGTHIALFFVDGNHHRKGIGRKLFQAALADSPAARMIVNASPYAVPVYHKFGFTDTDAEQVVNGLRFTPMEYH